MDSNQVATILRRYDRAVSLRSEHEEVWRKCYEYTFPLRSAGFGRSQLNAVTGQELKAAVMDSTATDSVRLLASSIMGGLTPANSRWFGLDVGTDESDEERRWLDKSGDIIWQAIHASNFDAAGYEACVDVAVAGWFALFIDEDTENGGYTFDQWPLGGVYVSASKAGGRIDTVFRAYTLSAEQAVNQFGEENVSQAIRTAAEKSPADRFEFIWAIYPRTDYREGARLARNLPIASCQIEKGTKKVVRKSGYHEMPVVVPRWMLVPDTGYGVGPVYDALPDIKTLNELRRMELAACDLAISGMWIAEDDGVLNPRTVKVGARKVIVANSVDSMKPLLTGSDFKVAWTKAEDLKGAIRKVLMADQLQPQDGPAMTATEVHVRVGLIRQLLGPIYGRMQAEYLQPLIERCFGIAFRAGALGQPPKSLAGRDFHVRYISPLARAQKLEDVTAIERLAANVGALAKTNPEVLDLIDYDQGVRIMAEGLGVPTKVVRESKAVAQLRDARAQQQQEQQEAAQQAQGQAAMQEAMAQRMATAT